MSTVLDNTYTTVSEAAAELRLTVQRVRQLIKSGQLPGEFVHTRLLVIPRKALDDFKGVARPSGYHVDKRPEAKPRRRRSRKTG